MFHPILLTGIALVGLPILLHLIMKQEPKKLSFPAFRFLKQKQFSNQRKLNNPDPAGAKMKLSVLKLRYELLILFLFLPLIV